MFGILRPCRHRLPAELHSAWVAQLCGLCLALRDDHGQLARLATNFDTLVISALVEAQAVLGAGRRDAKPCALRGMRPASVAFGDGARLAATVSLALASGKIADHVADGELTAGVPAPVARRYARRWGQAAAAGATALGFDVGVLTDPVRRQSELESRAGAETSLLTLTRPTEEATGAAFGLTAVIAGHPENVEPLSEAGRLFGRIAHLVDAVEDAEADAAAGKFNPITVTGTDLPVVRNLCEDAVLGVRLALRDVQFTDGRLIHTLLAHELDRAVHRTFDGETDVFCARHGAATDSQQPAPQHPAPQQHPPPDQNPQRPGDFSKGPDRSFRPPGLLVGCLGWLAVCGTCQVCCAEEYIDPCTGQHRRGPCAGCQCDGGCCDCCDCCDGGCCDCGCDC